MKRFLTTTAFVVATAGAAIAGSHSSQLQMEVADYLATSPMQIDVMSLTEVQIAQLHGAITGTDDAGERQLRVEAVLNDSNVMFTERSAQIMINAPRSQVYTQVKNGLVGTEFEGQAAMLTDEELVQAFSILNSTDSASEKDTKLKGVFN